MKKIILFLLFVVFCGVYGQEKKVEFTKKLNYKLTFKKNEGGYASPEMSFKSYVSKNKEFFTEGNIKGQLVNFYTENKDTKLVNIGLNNRLSANNLFAVYDYAYIEGDVFEQKYAASKLGTSETILGIPCNHYLLKPVFVNENEIVESNLKACINENYAINNMPVLSSIFNSLESYRKVDFNISGLLLKMGPEKNYNEEHLVLESITDNKDFVLVDYNKLLASNQKVKDSIAAERKKWEKLYASDSAAAAAAVDSATVSVDAAADAAAAADTTFVDSYYQIPDYVSKYKKADPEMAQLAIDNPEIKKLFNGIPKHCVNIEKELPVFENKDIRKHLKNYVGQICDMYLTQSEANNVDEKGTIDEIRREVLYLINIKDKLSQKDKKKLDQYLENLD